MRTNRLEIDGCRQFNHCNVVVQLGNFSTALGMSGVYRVWPDQDGGKPIVIAYIDCPACLTTYLPPSPPSQT